MPKPGHRSRSLRRVFVRTPGGESRLHYRKKKPAKARCGSCGAVLKGVASERPYKMQNMPRSRKKPQRPYGGMLCSRCMRTVIIEKERV